MWKFQGYEDPHYYIVINLVKSLGPVCQKINNCCWLVRVVCVLEDEVNDRDQGMGAGGTRDRILARIIVLGDVVKEALDTAGSPQYEPFK